MNSPASSYYLYCNDSQTGPFSAEQILKRFSTKKPINGVFIRTESMNKWVPLPVIIDALRDGQSGGLGRLVLLSLLALAVGAAAVWGASLLTASPQAKQAVPALPAKTAK